MAVLTFGASVSSRTVTPRRTAPYLAALSIGMGTTAPALPPSLGIQLTLITTCQIRFIWHPSHRGSAPCLGHRTILPLALEQTPRIFRPVICTSTEQIRLLA